MPGERPHQARGQLDAYHRDPRFDAKKPVLRGTWPQRCGDNLYSLGADSRWIRHRTLHHLDKESMRVKHATELVEAFRAWVATRFEPGTHDQPQDNGEATSHVERTCGHIRHC